MCSIYFPSSNSLLNIVSCSDDGSVVLLYFTNYFGGEVKDKLRINFNEPIKVTALIQSSSPEFIAGLCHRLFYFKISLQYVVLVGGLSGTLVHHRTVWFSQSNYVLFHGTGGWSTPGEHGGPVTTIQCHKSIVAWADFCHVRILDTATYATLCLLSCPSGIGLHRPFPCHLLWRGDQSLWIGWGNSVRLVKVDSQPPPSSQNAVSNVASQSTISTTRTELEWIYDFYIFGLCPFDVDNLLLITYGKDPLTWSILTLRLLDKVSGILSDIDNIRISDGDESSDVRAASSFDPWRFNLLSSYVSLSHDGSGEGGDSEQWSSARVGRGGHRGLAPKLVIVTGMYCQLSLLLFEVLPD